MSQIQKTVQTAEEIKVAWANWCKNAKEQKAAKKQANSTFAQNIINQEITQKSSAQKHKDRWDDCYSDYSDSWGKPVDSQVNVNASIITDYLDDQGNLVKKVIDYSNITPAQAAITRRIIAKIEEKGGYEYTEHSDNGVMQVCDLDDELYTPYSKLIFRYRKENPVIETIDIIDATSGINRFFEWLGKIFTKNR